MSTYIILQARTGSSRLPNKMLMPFHGNKGILEVLLTRIKQTFPIGFDNLIVATTQQPGDDKIERLCNRMCIKCYRGDENDVLGRFIEAAETVGADKIIRVCADNVYLDSGALRMLYDAFGKSDCDYMSFITSDGIPSIKTHYGFWAEGVTLETLKTVAANTSEKLYHEHVTNFVYAHPEQFKLCFTPIAQITKNIDTYKNLRLTIDTAADFKISQQIYQDLETEGLEITTENILSYLDIHPSLFDEMKEIINQNAK